MKTFSTLMLLFSIAAVSAQSIDRQVIASFGQMSSGSVRAESTLGEVVVFTFEGTDLIVNQGFNVGAISGSTPTIDIDGASIEVTTYPNPVQSELNIKIESEDIPFKYYSIHSTMGKLITKKELSRSTIQRVDVSAYPPGQYAVLLHTENRSYFTGWVTVLTH